jgi:hypothetical protein
VAGEVYDGRAREEAHETRRQRPSEGYEEGRKLEVHEKRRRRGGLDSCDRYPIGRVTEPGGYNGVFCMTKYKNIR